MKIARIEQPASQQGINLPKKMNPAQRTLDSQFEKQAFEEVFEKHWPPIYRLLARMVGDPSEAEDLALETFYRLYRRRDQAETDFNTAGWLRRVAVNLGLHSIRSFKRRLAHELASGEEGLPDARRQTPLDIVVERERQDLARAALAHMQARQSELLLMRYSGASYKEMAETFHLSRTSIGPLLLRAEREFAGVYKELAQENS